MSKVSQSIAEWKSAWALSLSWFPHLVEVLESSGITPPPFYKGMESSGNQCRFWTDLEIWCQGPAKFLNLLWTVSNLANCIMLCLCSVKELRNVAYSTYNYYAALLHRRGPHIALHSVCLSVCLSVRPVLAYLQKSVTCFRPTLRTCGIFCFVYICGPHTVGRSAAMKWCMLVKAKGKGAYTWYSAS